MEGGMSRANGMDFFAAEDIKQRYLESLSKMTRDQLYMELMRVHTRSSQLLDEAHKELDRVYELLNDDDEGDYFNHDTSN